MKDIVIVVDMQVGFARFKQTKELTKRIASLLEKKFFDSVIATRFLNDDNSIYEKLFSWHRLKTEEDRRLAPEIEKNVNFIFDKYIYNCVTPTFIQKLCQINDGNYPEKVYIMGADTDCCVMTIATALFENNIRPIVLTAYCDSNGGPDAHEAGVICLKRLIGECQIIDSVVNCKNDLDKM